MGARNHISDTGRCPRCGAEAPIADLLVGAHECEPWRQAAHEAQLILEQIELLEFEVSEFLRSDRGRAHLAFAQWCREHGR